ncbi:MAG: hypothetical protein ABI947_28400 [Chloroflexota bacterium]
MKKFIASTPNAEVLGESILGYKKCIKHDEIEPILLKYELHDVRAEDWYSHQMILNVLRDIEERKSNVSESLVAVGIKIMELATIPESVNSIEAVLQSLGVVYHLHHRNVSEIGWSVKSLGPRHMHVIPDQPYPEDLTYGVVWGAVKRFKSMGSMFTVIPINWKNDQAPTFYDVEWDV